MPSHKAPTLYPLYRALCDSSTHTDAQAHDWKLEITVYTIAMSANAIVCRSDKRYNYVWGQLISSQ